MAPPVNINGITVYDAAPSLAGSVSTPTGNDDLVLVRLGSYVGSGATAAGRAESISFDKATGQIFTTNAAQNAIDVALLNADGSATLVSSIPLSDLPEYGPLNAVATANGILAVAYQNGVNGQPGRVALFDTTTGTLIQTLSVGVLPDQLTFSPDGSKLLVANEGETISAANNPAGSVSIIDMSSGAAAATVATTISFAGLSGSEAALKSAGLSLFAGQAAGNDIEPEYISVSPDGTRAYVTLQEVNGVAVIDLTNPSATAPIAIQPLGYVDRNLAGNGFDPSDRDGPGNTALLKIINADVLSALQPDAIASFSVAGVTYFITANEGDARVGGLADEVRLSSGGYVLDPTAYPNAAALKANAVLGRLNVLTNIGDTDGDSDIDQIYTFGGRSISIFRQEEDGSITKVRETGGEFEAIIAARLPALHNSENGADRDGRSDNKGPEPEGVTVGKVGDRTYAFVSLERVGGVMVYDVTDPENATFVTYRPVTAEDYAPEVIQFVSGTDNVTGDSLVLTANEVSGTTTLYRAVAQTEGDDEINGSAFDDMFNGKGGNDQLFGFGGNDWLRGGDGNDIIDGGEGIDTALYDTAETGVAINLAGSGINRTGGAGDDRLISIENIVGSGFNDTISGDAKDNRFDGGAGDDRLLGLAGNDLLYGDAGNDFLAGGDNNDKLYGGANNDRLSGDAGDDLIVGGTGVDNMTGGAGNDIFAFAVGDMGVGSAIDIIGDFAKGDKIDLSAFTGAAFIGSSAFSGVAGQVRVSVGQNSSIVLIDANGDGAADAGIQISGKVLIDAGDFIL